MATGGAELVQATKHKAILAARAMLRLIPEDEVKSFSYSTAAASVILDVDAGTLADARKARLKALEDNTDIHPLSWESIHFLDTQPKEKYAAIELRNFLDRKGHANSLLINSQKLVSKYPPEIAPRVKLGFQTWLTQADPDELWPFCIQDSGRPLDLLAAMQLDQTTEQLEWMTIREFGERSADAASQDFHARQRQAMIDGLPEDSKPEWPTAVDRRIRPGGPL
jgi:hypothetical protein